jgi:AcrR family transcriptional regulator
MKLKKEKRPYNMTARAKEAARTERKILDVTAALWLKLPISEITLEQVAESASVTVRTILRKFGSKEGLFEACIEQDAGNLTQNRDQFTKGNLTEILHTLLSEYEIMGDAVIRTLTVEDQYSFARKLLDSGRTHHRKWCAMAFSPYLPDPSSEGYELHLLSFISATEIYLWKLLRRDLGQNFDQTLQVFRFMIEGIILNIEKNKPDSHEKTT